MNGDLIRKQWPVGAKVMFKPKGLMEGEKLYGEITDHIFVNVLIVDDGARRWFISTQRCELI